LSSEQADELDEAPVVAVVRSEPEMVDPVGDVLTQASTISASAIGSESRYRRAGTPIAAASSRVLTLKSDQVDLELDPFLHLQPIGQVAAVMLAGRPRVWSRSGPADQQPRFPPEPGSRTAMPWG
jgi:hypothetical protein